LIEECTEKWKNERIRLIKFTLPLYIQKFKMKDNQIMIARTVESDFKMRKVLIIGLIMLTRTFQKALE